MAQATTPKKQTQSKVKKSTDKYIVAIGASAGGLEAINAFFDKVPLDTNLSFVLIQHLSPDYKSMMPELLTKHTKLKVSKVMDATMVEPNCVYTIPADKNITITGGKLYLEDRGNPKTLNLPTNIFFKSLAEDQKNRAIAIVLSGTGSDGTLGIESIKEHGGMVIAQDPNTAAFDSMPKSAIATGLVDFILHPSRMPDTIMKYVKHPYVKQVDIFDDDGKGKGDEIFQILTILHQKTNLDFRHYKKATIIRRIERRMSIRNILSRELYLKYLMNDSEEVELLGYDMLIGVTGFFRDKKAFETLDKDVISQLVANAEKDKELRLWIVGCSTGQEVYTFAMLLKEQCRRQKKTVPIKIFATDIDQRAIDKASKGIYPEAVQEEIPKVLLNRYFNQVDDKFHVKKELREMAIFAKHDITRDPPFNNINLASCRNLLIYIEPLLQEKILSFIHFSLVEKGYLYLGSSETVGHFSKVFDEINKKYKIYQNRSVTRIVDINRLFPFDRKRNQKDQKEKPEDPVRVLSESKIVSNFKDALLEDMVPPTVIINENQDVVHVAGEVDNYIKLPKKQLTLNILKMIDEQLYVPLSNIISKARNQKKKIVSPVITFENDSITYLTIIAKPYSEPVSRISYCIISFVEATQTQPQLTNGASKKSDLTKEKDEHIKRLEEDIKETKEYLQSTIEELETSNEELQATNEELMAANEELQSSNEELQSVNEELYTVNNEFQDKLTEMTELNDDMNNFIQSTNIATLFLDVDLSVRRFTNIITPLIRISKNDIGRFIGDFNHVFHSFDLISIAKNVLDNFGRVEREVSTVDGKIYLMQASPYTTSRKEVKGVVFTFVDVNELKKIEKALLKQTEELERSNKELEQFAYLASHDLKAPISNLDALVNLIDHNDGVKDNSRNVFNKLKDVILQMSSTIRILNEVISIKKNLDLKPEQVKLENALNDVLISISDQVTSYNTEINTDFKECDSVLFPPVHLQSILQNLITNAIKYRQEDKAPIINISCSKIDGYTCLTVQDNGRGLNMKNYGQKLFGLFQRFHLDTEGKGIGLHITKSIVEKYGGYIEVESEVGQGTEFKVYFNNKAK